MTPVEVFQVRNQIKFVLIRCKISFLQFYTSQNQLGINLVDNEKYLKSTNFKDFFKMMDLQLCKLCIYAVLYKDQHKHNVFLGISVFHLVLVSMAEIYTYF